jgi:hypothetical protein
MTIHCHNDKILSISSAKRVPAGRWLACRAA